VLGGSRLGLCLMDSFKCQTFTASPAEPGVFPNLIKFIDYLEQRFKVFINSPITNVILTIPGKNGHTINVPKVGMFKSSMIAKRPG
jgi:hypothetical protein